MGWWQDVIAWLIVMAAALYVLDLIRRTAAGKRGCGCGKPTCAPHSDASRAPTVHELIQIKRTNKAEDSGR